MRCRKAERLIQKSFDGLLKPAEQKELDSHLLNCPACRKMLSEYSYIFGALREEPQAESKPFFWERLQPHLKAAPEFNAWPLWKKWGMRAIPISLVVIIILAVAAFFILPQPNVELSQSAFLLQNQNPFKDSLPLLEADKSDNPNMMLIFTAMDDKSYQRRYFP
ncbi:MAG: zf-HC2 domain-containing protein [Candidatus Aminicenantes bacterium]|nr:zf-HC2 domain-containing protein [Candidatus Aminicenantes bacterium]